MKINKTKEGMHPERIRKKQGRIRDLAPEHNARQFSQEGFCNGAV